MFKKILFILFLLIAIGAAAAFFIVSRSFNSETFMQQFIVHMQELTGRTVTVEKSPVLVWNPIPTLTLQGVNFSNATDSSVAEMLKIEEIQIQMDWQSLFEQPTKIKKVLVKHPELLVERFKNGKTNLQFAQLFRAQNSVEEQGLLGEFQRAAQIDTIEIMNGVVRYEDMISSSKVVLNSLYGNISLKSLTGPISFNGRALWDSVPLDIGVTMGALKISQPIDIEGKILEPTSHTTMDFRGRLFPDDPDQYLTLDGSVNTEQPNELLKLLALDALPQAMNVPSFGNFKLDLTPKAWVWENVNVRVGSENEMVTALSGKWTHHLFQKKLEGNLTITSCDYDTWYPLLQSALMQSTLSKFGVITGTLDIEKVVVNNSKIEKVHTRGTYQNDSLKVREFSALLPGGTSVEANGTVQFKPKINLKGMVELRIENTSDLLTFLQIPIQTLDNSVFLRQGFINTSVNLSEEQSRIKIERFSLDKMNGSGVVVFQKDKNIVLDLNLKHVNLDGYLGLQMPDKSSSIQEDIQSLMKSISTISMPKVPIAWEVNANDVILRHIPIQNVKAKGSITPSDLSASIMLEDMAATNINTEFKIDYAGTDKWLLSSGKMSFVTGQMDVFLRRAMWKTDSEFFDGAKQLSFDVSLSGSPEEWSTEGAFKKQTLDVNFKGKLVPEGLKDMEIQLTHPDFRLFMHGVGKDLSEFPGLTGELKFVGNVSGTLDKLSVKDMTLDIGNQQLMGAWYYEPNNRKVTADLQGTSLNLAKFLPDLPPIYIPSVGFSEQNLTIEKLSPWTVDLKLNTKQLYYKSIDFRNLQLQFSLKDKALNVQNFSALWGQSDKAYIQTSGRLNWNTETPELNMNLQLQNLPLRPDALMIDTLGLTKGVLNLTASGRFTGYSPKEMLENSSGQGSLSLSDSTWVGIDVAAAQKVVRKALDNWESVEVFEPALTQALMNGKSLIQGAKADFAVEQGVFKITNGEMRLPEAQVSSAQITYSIPTSKISAKLSLLLDANLPPILYTLDNTKRLAYYADVKQFSKAIETEILNLQKDDANRKVVELRNQTMENLKNKKAEALAAVEKLKNRLNDIEQQLIAVPDPAAQEYWRQAQSILLSIAPLAQKDLESVQGYIQVIDQANVAHGILTQGEQSVFDKNLNFYDQKATAYLTEIDKLLLEMTTFHYKKKELSILSALIQGCQEQKNVIQRATVQLKRHLTPEQARKVFDIIEDAYNKVKKAHQYAYDLYTDKVQAPDSGSISFGGH